MSFFIQLNFYVYLFLKKILPKIALVSKLSLL